MRAGLPQHYFAATRVPSSTSTITGSELLKGKRAIVYDPISPTGPTAQKAEGIKLEGGSVQVVNSESALATAIQEAMVGRAIVLLPQSTTQPTVDRLIKLENIKKGVPLYVVGNSTSLKNVGIVSTVADVTAKVKKLLK